MNLPIFEKLGVLDDVEGIGIRKYGVEFNWKLRDKPTTYYFANALNHPYAYQVQRNELDKILFNNAKRKGVEALEEMHIINIEFQANGSSIIDAKDKDGNVHRLSTG